MHSLSPASTESLLLALRQPIALVGNGHPGRELGAVIDRYPTVIRFNNYRVAGFEQLIGARTSVRAVNGWTDLDTRDGEIAISPFTADAVESTHLPDFRLRQIVPVLHATTDVHALLPDEPKPSTGLALAALISHLGLEADCFGFDGFASGHYWDPGVALHTTHSRTEAEQLLRLPGITLYGKSFDYATLYDFCHTEHAEYDVNEGLTLFTQLQLTMPNESVLEFGAGNGELARYLEDHGASVTAVEVSPTALARIPIERKILGDALTLCTIEQPFDRFVSVDVLEHLTENDVRIVAREAARLANTLTVTVCTRPSGLVGPHGENLHLTVRPVRWWQEVFGRWFDVTATVGHGIGQVLLQGTRRRIAGAPLPAIPLVSPPAPLLELPETYTARAQPEYFVDSVEVTGGVTWQPDVYEMAAAVARASGCDTIVDVGCGQARKLAALHPEFRVVGVDYGDNIAFCRRTYSFGSWLESDLEQHELLPLPPVLLGQSVVVCSDVIEHLIDPRALLATLRDLLEHGRYVVLTTPDRVRTHGAGHAGPPPNPAHTREWTTEELARFCELEGLRVLAAGHTRSNDAEPDLATVALVLTRRQSVADARVIEAAAGSGLTLLVPESNDPSQLVPSVQTGLQGAPRFSIAVPDATTRERIAATESHGGIEAETRIFLDAQLEAGDVVVDLAPGAGFVALSAATAPGGAPTVLAYSADLQARKAWRRAALAAGRQLLAAHHDRRATLALDLARHVRDSGRLFAHVAPNDVDLLLDACRAAGCSAQLVAVCVAPTENTVDMALAAARLQASKYVLHHLVDQGGEIVLQHAATQLDEGVIAIPASLLASSFEEQALPAAS
ncbi:glycosyltransferase family 29 protein [Gemmatimonas sp.]